MTEQRLQITVGEKQQFHPYHGRGSSLAFLVNGVGGVTIPMVRGVTYTFEVNTAGHTLYLTTSNRGGAGMPGRLEGFSPAQTGLVAFTPTADTPGTFYYQSGEQEYMGGGVQLFDDVQEFQMNEAFSAMRSSANAQFQQHLQFRLEFLGRLQWIWNDIYRRLPALRQECSLHQTPDPAEGAAG